MTFTRTVERKSGLLRIGPLPRATVGHTNARLIRLVRDESHRVRTLTSDNGTEFYGYKHIERQLGLRVNFATPHHAWERGINGLLRQ
jgi:IS30 family transposase